MKVLSFITLPSLWLTFFLMAGCSVSPEAPARTLSSVSSQGSWSQRAPMPIGISQVAMAALGNRIYVVSGSTPDRVDHSLNLEYDIASNRWRERAPLPRGLTHSAATVLNGRVYVVAGFTTGGHGGAVNSVYEYDPAKDVWRPLAPLKSPRGSVGVAALDGRLHAIGGRGLDKVTVTTHEVYDPGNNRWTDRAPLPTARDHLAVVAANGRIHAIGGRTNSPTQNVDHHDIYNPGTNSWTAGAPLPTARHAFRGVAVGRNLYFAGGRAQLRRRSQVKRAVGVTLAVMQQNSTTSIQPILVPCAKNEEVKCRR